MKIQHPDSSDPAGQTRDGSRDCVGRKSDKDVAIPFLRSRSFWAERLGICEATLARAAKRGDLSFERLGDRVLHSPEHITDWLARHERKARG